MAFYSAYLRKYNIYDLKYFFRKIFNPLILPRYNNAITACIDPLNVSPWIKDAIYKGFYEYHEIQALKYILKPSDIVIEAGAGIGFTSALICKLAKKSFHLEANRRLIRSIYANILYNHPKSNFSVLAAAAGAEKGSFTLCTGENFWNSSSYQSDKHTNSTIVPQISLFDLARDNSATGLLIDIEGAEETIFKEDIPPSVNWIILELHPKIIGFDKCSELSEHIKYQGFAESPNSPGMASQVAVFERA